MDKIEKLDKVIFSSKLISNIYLNNWNSKDNKKLFEIKENRDIFIKGIATTFLVEAIEYRENIQNEAATLIDLTTMNRFPFYVATHTLVKIKETNTQTTPPRIELPNIRQEGERSFGRDNPITNSPIL